MVHRTNDFIPARQCPSAVYGSHIEVPGTGKCLACGSRFTAPSQAPRYGRTVDDFTIRLDPVTLEPVDPMESQ